MLVTSKSWDMTLTTLVLYIYIPSLIIVFPHKNCHKMGYNWRSFFGQSNFEPLVLVKYLPSGKHTKNYGKSPCLMSKSTISMAIFNSKLLNYQRVPSSSVFFFESFAKALRLYSKFEAGVHGLYCSQKSMKAGVRKPFWRRVKIEAGNINPCF